MASVLSRIVAKILVKSDTLVSEPNRTEDERKAEKSLRGAFDT